MYGLNTFTAEQISRHVPTSDDYDVGGEPAISDYYNY